MAFEDLYRFLFETYAGIGILVAASLVICIVVAAILELRTRKTYVDRGPRDEDDDEWALFDDEDEDESDRS